MPRKRDQLIDTLGGALLDVFTKLTRTLCPKCGVGNGSLEASYDSGCVVVRCKAPFESRAGSEPLECSFEQIIRPTSIDKLPIVSLVDKKIKPRRRRIAVRA